MPKVVHWATKHFFLEGNTIPALLHQYNAKAFNQWNHRFQIKSVLPMANDRKVGELFQGKHAILS